MKLSETPWEDQQHLKDAVYSLRIAGNRWKFRRMKHNWIIYRGGDIALLREATYATALYAIAKKRLARLIRGYKIEINP